MKFRALIAATAFALMLPWTASADTCSAGPVLTCSSSLSAWTPELWVLTVSTGGAGFKVTTKGTTAFDSQLFLFDNLGHGLWANDDDADRVQLVWISLGSRHGGS